MPVRDGGPHLKEALDSIQASSLEDWELLVANHGSKDETQDILFQFASKDSRIQIVEFSRETSFITVLEQTRRRCNTPYMARMDADDLMHKDRLAGDFKMLEVDSQISVVSSQVELFPASQVKEGMTIYMDWQNKILLPKEHDLELWIEQTICNPAATFRLKAVDDVGGYQEGAFPEDYDLFVRLNVAGHQFRKRPEIGHYWRRHDASLSVRSMNFSHNAFATVKARGLFEKFHLNEKPVCVLGSGRHGGRIAKLLMGHGATVKAFFDISPVRIGKERHGVRILAQDQLASWKKDHPHGFAIGAVGVRGRRPIVRQLMAEAGFVENRDAICIA